MYGYFWVINKVHGPWRWQTYIKHSFTSSVCFLSRKLIVVFLFLVFNHKWGIHSRIEHILSLDSTAFLFNIPFHPTSVHCNPLIPTVDCRQVVQHCRKMISVPSTNYFRFSWQIIRTRERKFGSILVIVALNWQRGYGHGILYDRSISVLTQANWIVKIIQSVNNIPIRIRRL